MVRNTNQLKPGDILLFKPKSIFHVSAWFIAWAQNVIGKNPISGARYCHVAIIDEDTDYILEARWPKTHKVLIDWGKINKAYEVELWRVKSLTNFQLQDVLGWCDNHLGEWYDLGNFIWGMFDSKHKEVCSTFVANAYRAAGIDFKQHKVIGDGALITPDEIAASEWIYKVALL